MLLVDDDPGDRVLVRRCLAAVAPDTVLTIAEDGEAAVRCLLTGDPRAMLPPDLVLLDLNLPRLDGITVLRTLRAEPATHALAVVVLTTSRRTEDVAAAYAAGADAFVVKPGDVAELTRLLAALTARRFEQVAVPRPSGS